MNRESMGLTDSDNSIFIHFNNVFFFLLLKKTMAIYNIIHMNSKWQRISSSANENSRFIGFEESRYTKGLSPKQSLFFS